MLADYGVDFVQGYFLGKPAPAEEAFACAESAAAAGIDDRRSAALRA